MMTKTKSPLRVIAAGIFVCGHFGHYLCFMENMKNISLQPGDVVYMTCTDILICYHIGIVVRDNGELCMYHNTPSKKNQYGGNIVCQPLDSVLKERKVLNVVKCALDCPDFIKQYSWDNRFRKWDTFKYNCEDYVNDIWRCQRGSVLRTIWVSALVFTIAKIA